MSEERLGEFVFQPISLISNKKEYKFPGAGAISITVCLSFLKKRADPAKSRCKERSGP